MIEIHRQHLDAEKRDVEKRDVGRELPIHGGWDADSTASSFSFSPRGTLPSFSHMIGKDLEKSIECVLSGVDVIDRTVRTLSHFAEPTHHEVSLVLKMSNKLAVHAMSEHSDVFSVYRN